MARRLLREVRLIMLLGEGVWEGIEPAMWLFCKVRYYGFWWDFLEKKKKKS